MTSNPPTAAELQSQLASEFQSFVDSLQPATSEPTQHEHAAHEARPIRQRVMLGQGYLTLTITNTQRGHHRTIRFAPRLARGERSRSTWSRNEWWVKDDSGAYIGILVIDGNGALELRFTAKSTQDRAARYAATLCVIGLNDGESTFEERGETYSMLAADTCGRCNRELTDPVSIERGIGPECYGKSTGSKRAKRA
jgi:hypothetical protein